MAAFVSLALGWLLAFPPAQAWATARVVTDAPAMATLDSSAPRDAVKTAARSEPPVAKAPRLSRVPALPPCCLAHAATIRLGEGIGRSTPTVLGRRTGWRRSPIRKPVPRMECGEPPRR